MATRINPKSKKLLYDFITYLERRGDVNGWVIVSKSGYDDGKHKKIKHAPVRPPKSKRQYVKFFLEWKEMGESDLDYEIDRFLSKVNE